MTSPKYLPLRLVLCLQIVLLATVYANDPKRYCGPVLTQTLRLLCREGYASPGKRSDDGEDYEYINDEPITYPRLAYQPYPFVRDFHATSALGMRVRRDYTAVKRGVYDECCRSACTLRQLMSYCAA